MWLLMICCYLLMAGSFLALLLTGLQGYFGFSVLGASHALVALATIILYLFSETLIMFFFIGTGVNIKDYLKEHNGNTKLYDRVKKSKMIIFPKMMMSICLIGVVFIIGGAVDRALVPAWVHGTLFIGALLYYARLIVLEHRCFRDNTNIILEMCGIEREGVQQPTPSPSQEGNSPPGRD